MDLISVGRITETHHLKGAMKIVSDFSELEDLIGNKVMLEKQSETTKILTVKNISLMVGKKWIIEFEEITNKTEAEMLRNATIKVRRDILGIVEDEYIEDDIIGMKVVSESGEMLGEVVDVYETAAHGIFIVEDEEHEIMIPNIENFVKNIDFEKNEIRVSLIEGMIEKKRR